MEFWLPVGLFLLPPQKSLLCKVYIPAKQEYIIQQLCYCQFYMLKRYLKLKNDRSWPEGSRIPGLLSWVGVPAGGSGRLSICERKFWVLNEMYLVMHAVLFYFHKKLSRGLGMRPAARVISMTPLLAYETKTEQVVFHLLIASFRWTTCKSLWRRLFSLNVMSYVHLAHC